MKATSYSLNNSISQIEVDAGLLSETYTVSVEDGSKIDLPDSFSSPIRGISLGMQCILPEPTGDNHTATGITGARDPPKQV